MRTRRAYRTLFDHHRGLIAGLCSCLVLLAIGAPAHADTVTVTQDTIIDGANSYPNDSVAISNGSSGPTSAKMVSGGTVRGFIVSGNSAFEITGGASTFLSGTKDSATLVMRGGEIGCTAMTCQVIDYDALLHISDNSSLQFFGGAINGVISLDDQSTAHFFGSGLSLTNPYGDILVQGTFNGVNQFFAFNNTPTTAARIFLHEVPEPAAWLLGIIACIFVVARQRGRVRYAIAPSTIDRGMAKVD